MASTAETFRAWPDEPDPQAVRWRNHLLWSAVIATAILVYELTANATLGAIIACSKFGWDDIFSGIWLLRRDERRLRGWACCWFYIATGLWRMSVAAAVIFVLFLIAQMNIGMPPGKLVLYGLLLTAGFILSLLATWIGLVLARVGGIRVWVDPRVHWARIEGYWPPHYSRVNRARLVTFTAFWTSLFLFPAVLTGVCAMLLNQFGPRAELTLLCVVIMVPLAASLARLSMGDNTSIVVARTPWECWPEHVDRCQQELGAARP